MHKEGRYAAQQHVIAAVTVTHILPARNKFKVSIDRKPKASRADRQVGEDELALG